MSERKSGKPTRETKNLTIHSTPREFVTIQGGDYAITNKRWELDDRGGGAWEFRLKNLDTGEERKVRVYGDGRITETITTVVEKDLK